ncbi:hypothetical protein WICPIJ_003171 [Wickerhamomyces pijperi]|uniref:Uncharacterized protein n=1 Tax=Wickerhamomyces pijperi TaxID=599730 RepID=A0A9P8Q8D4_WICPI|nr:hypothetical protein WICPIJ_003171 [Wickerhamomyces pijperi]
MFSKIDLANNPESACSPLYPLTPSATPIKLGLTIIASSPDLILKVSKGLPYSLLLGRSDNPELLSVISSKDYLLLLEQMLPVLRMEDILIASGGDDFVVVKGMELAALEDPGRKVETMDLRTDCGLK